MRGSMLLSLCSVALLVGCAGKGSTDIATVKNPSAPSAVAAPKPAHVAHFGADQKLSDVEAVPVGTVLANPAEYANKYVRLTGTVTSVCPKKGCWLRLAAGPNATAGEDVFVKFPDPPEGRLVPLEAEGKPVTVEGTLKIGRMSEAQARHFKEDAGASKEEIAKIVGPQRQIVIAQPAVAIAGVESEQK